MPRKKKTPGNRFAKGYHIKDAKSGKFVHPSGMTKDERWNCPGIKGFAYWFSDIAPHILHRDGKYKKIKLTQKQGEILKQIYALDDNGNLQHSISLNIEPRRHGKNIINALVTLHHFCSRKNFTIQLVGNTEGHSRRVQFNLLLRIIGHTPKLRLLLNPKKNATRTEIEYPAKGNIIQAMSGVNAASAFGDRVSLIWCSDMHASTDQSYFNALQASLLDSDGSIILIDSNVDALDGHVHSLQREAKDDPSIYALHVSYQDFTDFEKNAPDWINRQKARRMEKLLLPSEFKRDILGQRSESQNALFTSEIIDLCKDQYKIPVEDIKALTQGRAYKIGAGLDRAKNIFGSAAGGDNTVFTVILKVASPRHGEPEIYLLDQTVIFPNTSRMVKKTILNAHEKYHLDNFVLEAYEITDLIPYLEDLKIPHETLSAHEANQVISFTEFFRTAKEGRFHFPETLTGLESEMKTFSYTLKSNGKYGFGHSSQKFHCAASLIMTIFQEKIG